VFKLLFNIHKSVILIISKYELFRTDFQTSKRNLKLKMLNNNNRVCMFDEYKFQFGAS
jgi:hypothetical protein